MKNFREPTISVIYSKIRKSVLSSGALQSGNYYDDTHFESDTIHLWIFQESASIQL